MMNNNGEIIIYDNGNGNIKLEVRFQDENVWLTQKLMAELFQTTPQNITLHLKNIFDEGELDELSTCKDFLQVQNEGGRKVKRSQKFYNLDAIIAVGYRVKSLIATQFRIWATQRLKEYLIKGFVIDDERLKNPPVNGSALPDYFDEMLARIRDIRASERRMYLRVKEIFSMAADYKTSSNETHKFFSIIQNKLHFASTGMTAAEIIKSRANATLRNMGLTNWKREEIRKSDVTTAKNYLSEKEIDNLNRIVVMWLDYAEDQANRRKQVFMKDWEEKLDAFLKFNEREVLTNAGNISTESAKEYAENEFEKFAIQRRELKETIAEQKAIRQLEKTAKRIDKGDKNES